jgi:hypothetical protein
VSHKLLSWVRVAHLQTQIPTVGGLPSREEPIPQGLPGLFWTGLALTRACDAVAKVAINPGLSPEVISRLANSLFLEIPCVALVPHHGTPGLTTGSPREATCRVSFTPFELRRPPFLPFPTTRSTLVSTNKKLQRSQADWKEGTNH